MVTAKVLELGREVFAVPGPIGSPASAGTNQLLKEGARLVTSAVDILEELHGVGVAQRPSRPRADAAVQRSAEPSPRHPPPDLAGDEARVFTLLREQPVHIDELAIAANLPASSTLAVLLGLELRELVQALPGKLYRLRSAAPAG